jgi:hypothetical protein
MTNKIIKKQLKVLKKITEGKSQRQAIKEAGYSDSLANKPKALTTTKTWEEIIRKQLDDKLLAKVHHKGLKATKRVGKDSEMEVPDYAVRHQYLETAYKLKGKLQPEATEVQINIISSIPDIVEPIIIEDKV